MKYEDLTDMILGKINRGDIMLIEYSSLYQIEKLAWGSIIPSLVQDSTLVVWDFFGVGNLLFKNYIRRCVKPIESVRLVEVLKKIKVVKIGPGTISYGEVIEEISPSYKSQEFIKNYYSTIQRMERLPLKPTHLVTFGISSYIAFGGEETIKNILMGLSTIPMEDWVTINFVNVDTIKRNHLAMLEEIATDVVFVSSEGIIVRKGGDAIDSRG